MKGRVWYSQLECIFKNRCSLCPVCVSAVMSAEMHFFCLLYLIYKLFYFKTIGKIFTLLHSIPFKIALLLDFCSHKACIFVYNKCIFGVVCAFLRVTLLNTYPVFLRRFTYPWLSISAENSCNCEKHTWLVWTVKSWRSASS